MYVSCNTLCLHPPSKFKIYNVTHTQTSFVSISFFSVCSIYYQHFVRLQPLLGFTGEHLTATTLQSHILMLRELCLHF